MEVFALQREDRLEERRMRMRAMAGMLDFLGVIGCTILIIALVAFFASLVTWLITDLTQSFSDLQRSVTEALLVQ